MWLQRTSAPTATPASWARGMVVRTRYSAATCPNPSPPDTSTLAASRRTTRGLAAGCNSRLEISSRYRGM